MIISLCVSILSCDDGRVDDPFVFQSFPNISFNINLPAYSNLQIDGGHTAFSDFNSQFVGIRGIIVYRENATTFRAFEQACSFQPNEPTSIIDDLTPYMRCSGCASNFNYEGNPIGNGPAWRPLAQYRTTFSGSTVTITDEVINY